MPVFENEKEFETTLMENQDILIEWFGGGEWANQINLPGYGIADIIGVSCEVQEDDVSGVSYNFTITVIELKVNKIKKEDITQICRYKTAMERMIDKVLYADIKYTVECNYYLIGSDVGGHTVYLFDNIDWLNVMTYTICPINGLTFDSHNGWYATDENPRKQFKNLLPQIISVKKEAHDFYLYEKKQVEEYHGSTNQKDD